MTAPPGLEEIAAWRDQALAAFVLGDGRLAWSSHMLERALATTAELAEGAPEPLLQRAWQLLACRELDRDVFEFCRALGGAALGGHRAAAGWDLRWMLGTATPAQACLRYWTLALRPELWDERTERETMSALATVPFLAG